MPRPRDPLPNRWCLAPENLDIEVMAERHPPRFGSKTPFIAGRAYLLVDALYRAARRYNATSDDDFIPVPSTYWREIVNDYAPYLKWLHEAGIIDIDPRYFAAAGKGRCKRYRLNASFRTPGRSVYVGQAKRPIETIGAASLGDEVAPAIHSSSQPDPVVFASHANDGRDGSGSISVPSNRSVTASHSVASSSSSCSSVVSIFWSRLSPYYVPETLRDGGEPFQREVVERLRAVFNRVSIAELPVHSTGGPDAFIESNADAAYLLDIRHHQPLVRLKETTGRLYTAVTQMSREARRRLRIDGSDDLAVVDIRTCFPYLLIHVARRVQDINPAIISDFGIEAWADVVLNNDIYALGVWAMEERFAVKQTRDMWKADIQRILNARPSQRNYADGRRFYARDIIAALFPEMMAVIDFVKRYPTPDHKRLSTLLTYLEGDTMLWHVCPELLDAGIPVLTVHDAVIVPTRYAPYAADLVRDAFARLVGIAPNIKVTGLT